MSGAFSKNIKNELSELTELVVEIHSFLDPMNLPAKPLYALDLALEEMLTNIVKYGYDDKKPHLIGVDIHAGKDSLVLTLTDDGHEFNPLSAVAPDTGTSVPERPVGGVGIHLTRSMVDDMKYRREGDKNVLEIKIRL
ncbi:MAG: hypothetical protein A2020_01910 [Lentisphaerae bacterium GWF2_45_14]|nr:MAG: hypothetical protein A2020_01910 [Lentisphaerae bacterium GWF2_45_14]